MRKVDIIIINVYIYYIYLHILWMGWDSPLLLRYIYGNHALSGQDE